MKAPMSRCLLQYHTMPHKNFYVPGKEEVEGRAGWRGKIQETDTVQKFVAPCRSRVDQKKKKKRKGSK